VIGVVHLVWGPLGPAPLRSFLASYRAHPAGAEHELVVLFNGVTDEVRPALLAELADVPHRLVELERPVLDLAAYAEAAGRIEHERICLLNSYTELLAGGWLGLLAAAQAEPGVGIAGATGSFESHADWRRSVPLLHRVYNVVMLARLRRHFPPFPNPHVRTNGVLLDRELLLSLGLERARDKSLAYQVESGRRGITPQVRDRGLDVVLVGRDGRRYAPAEWPESGLFRSGEQQNLLIADNQTRAYESASPAERAELRRNTWGRFAGTT
jgi:hypothetical protein